MILKRILIADDFTPVHTLVATLLGKSFEVVGTVSDGRAVIDAVLELKPDLLILDISMPGKNGLEVARQLKSLANPSKVVFLTAHRDDAIVAACLSAGAQGYVVKSFMNNDLIPTVNDALAGRIFVSQLSSSGFPMASPAIDFRTSLIPIFAARLKTLRAIALGLRDLPRPAFDEIQSILARAEVLIRESVGPVPAED
jgi:DNA-binding NarL/FixJ family response regulator